MWKTPAAVLLVLTLFVPAPPAAALDTGDLLGLVAMPLAVAAVSELTDVPMNDLVDVVTLMNDAYVPPAQFIEVVRYAPVALVTTVEGPTFVEYVRLREQEGLTGLALINSIEDRLRVYNLPGVELNVVAPRYEYFDDDDFSDYVPPIVRTRVTDWRSSHPHGGPPGQLKKELGLQTGAEVVHGSRPNKVENHGNRDARRVIADRDDDRPAKVKPAKVKPQKQEAVTRPHGNSDHARGNSGSGGGNKGGGKGNGKGKGKG